MLSPEEARARLIAHPLPANPWVYVTDDAIVIKADYTDTIERMLRWVPRSRWSARRRCWLVPLSGLELVRSILPELSRLAEAMQGAPAQPAVADAARSAEDQGRVSFRDYARLLFGSDWQRETARALGREEAALARWVAGEAVMEAPAAQLLAELQALMCRRAQEIQLAADALAVQLQHYGD